MEMATFRYDKEKGDEVKRILNGKDYSVEEAIDLFFDAMLQHPVVIDDLGLMVTHPADELWTRMREEEIRLAELEGREPRPMPRDEDIRSMLRADTKKRVVASFYFKDKRKKRKLLRSGRLSRFLRRC